MKKFVAASLSAALLAGTVSTVVMAEEAAVASSSDVITIAITADGETMEAGLVALNSESGDTSLSAYATLPPSMLGTEEPMTLELADLVKVVAGDCYLNIDAVLGLYQNMTGDASLVSLTTMVGIDQPFVVIPKLEIEAAAAEEPVVSEELAAALMECVSGFEMTETETGAVVSFNDDSLLAAVTAFEAVYETYGEELSGLMATDSESTIDVKTVFADYILAAAEGMAEVDTTSTVDANVEMINMMVDMVMEEAMASADLSVDTEVEGVESASMTETVAAALETIDVEGTITVDQTETEMVVVADVNVTEAEQTVNVMVSFVSTMDGEFSEITAPEATPLRDIVKNGVIIYYSMMMAEMETAAAE
ncbi:MAG: hypothetical protein IJ468_13420 [Lachnospiraceae bacterium]|nr:hypothetical protein [Lachnospiraceae bacterium]